MCNVLHVLEAFKGEKVILGSRRGMQFAVESVLPYLDRIGSGEGLCIDLDGIAMIDDSFANQAFAAPIMILTEGHDENRGKFIYFKVENSFIKTVIERALLDNGLIAMVYSKSETSFVGSTGVTLIDTIRRIDRAGEITSDHLPDVIGEGQGCLNRLQRLLSFGIVREFEREGIKWYSLARVGCS